MYYTTHKNVYGVGRGPCRYTSPYTDPGHIPTRVNTQPSLYYIAYTCTKVNERSYNLKRHIRQLKM